MYVGEVIEASTTRFRAQSRELNAPPALGSFVRIPASTGETRSEADPFEGPAWQEGTVYGIVVEAATGSLEPGRRPAAYGLDEEQLRREQPQIFELLVTEFACLVVGHVEGGAFRDYLPPSPPRIHARVEPCGQEEVCAVTERLEYLRAVIAAPDCAACDEVIAASVRQACRCRGGDQEFLVRAGKRLAILLRDDYDRLSAVLRKLG